MDFHESLLHTLKLSADELSALLDKDRDKDTDAVIDRAHLRTPYRVPDGIVIETIDRGAGQDCARVAPRDISTGGIGVLHRGSLPGGTPVDVYLPLFQTGSINVVSGRVVRSFCVTGEIHELGVAFDEPIDLNPILKRRNPR